MTLDTLPVQGKTNDRSISRSKYGIRRGYCEKPRAAHKLPDPKGYKILINLPEPETASEGGILKAQETIDAEEVGSIIGFVIKLGQTLIVISHGFLAALIAKRVISL